MAEAATKLGRGGIAARLRELGGYLRLAGESRFRARAYETAAASVEALGPRFDELLAEGRLAEVPGIGDKLAATIKTLHERGTTSTLDRLRAEMPPGVLDLAELPGLSVAKVRVLHEALGIDSAAALAEAARAGRVRQVRGFGARSEAKLLEALDRAPPAPPELLLLHARDIAAGLRAEIAELPGVTRVEIAGAVRRWQDLVGTICLVGASDDPDAALEAYLRRAPSGEVLDRQRAGARPGHGARVRHRLVPAGAAEIEFVAPATFAAAWVRQSSTSAHWNALAQRARAHGMGFDLAELQADSEAAVYGAVGLPELPPELRDDPAFLALADAGDTFADLIAADDIRGFVHCHTTASDGRHDLREMAAAAAARGMRYLTVTDHSPTASYAGGLTTERLGEQAAEIAQLRRDGALPIDVLRGTESDIRADGTLDFPPEILTGLDVVIASIHNRYGMDAQAMTARLLTAMGQPLFKIWGHPLGRILLHRDPVACDVPAVLDAARAGRAAIEINGDPHRLDLPAAWLGQARARGLRFVISVDAHSIRDYDNLAFGVHLARRAGIRRHEVLNTLPADRFRAIVAPG
jgi:DNA polymerase (family 10)